MLVMTRFAAEVAELAGAAGFQRFRRNHQPFPSTLLIRKCLVWTPQSTEDFLPEAFPIKPSEL
jgi:hypothetical protein